MLANKRLANVGMARWLTRVQMAGSGNAPIHAVIPHQLPATAAPRTKNGQRLKWLAVAILKRVRRNPNRAGLFLFGFLDFLFLLQRDLLDPRLSHTDDVGALVKSIEFLQTCNPIF